MTPRERVFAALAHQRPDRVPRFEVWIDAFAVVEMFSYEREVGVYG